MPSYRSHFGATLSRRLFVRLSRSWQWPFWRLFGRTIPGFSLFRDSLFLSIALDQREPSVWQGLESRAYYWLSGFRLLAKGIESWFVGSQFIWTKYHHWQRNASSWECLKALARDSIKEYCWSVPLTHLVKFILVLSTTIQRLYFRSADWYWILFASHSHHVWSFSRLATVC